MDRIIKERLIKEKERRYTLRYGKLSRSFSCLAFGFGFTKTIMDNGDTTGLGFKMILASLFLILISISFMIESKE